MSRYVNVLRTGMSPEQAQGVITGYLQGEGFKYLNERAEMVWRKGIGALANPQFIKAEPSPDGTVRIEAWTAGVSLVPGVYGGELDPMSGAFGFGPKLALRPRIKELERRLGGVAGAPQVVAAGSAAVPPAAGAQSQAGPGSLPPAGWHPDPTRRHEHRYWDGAQWTTNVSDAGQASTDPQGAA